MAVLLHKVHKLELVPSVPRQHLPCDLSRKKFDKAYGVNPCATLSIMHNIEIFRCTGRGAKLNVRKTFNLDILTSRRNRRCAQSNVFKSLGTAWCSAEVRDSIKVKMCALYKNISWLTEKCRLQHNNVINFQPASCETSLEAATTESWQLNRTHIILKSPTNHWVRCIQWKDSFTASNNIWLADPQRCSSDWHYARLVSMTDLWVLRWK